jgi:integrase
MYSKTRKGRSGKGSVQIKVSHGRLQLVFSHPVITLSGEFKGKRFYLSTGQEDTPFGRQRAAILADTIQRDLDYDEFDVSLQKYKRAAAPQEFTPITPIEPLAPKTDLSDLWEKYAQFKKPQISQSTYIKDYRKYSNHIATLPSRDLEKAIAIRDHLLATLTPNAAKRTLTNINACCNWALKSKLIEANPFMGMSRDIQIPALLNRNMIYWGTGTSQNLR